MATNTARLLNIGLRFSTLGTRFFFIFVLAKFLDPASVGYYGIFTATVGYCLYLIGLDFYTYLTREVLKTPIEQRGQLIKAQAALSGVLYLIFFPIALVLLTYVDWPGKLALWFFPLLMLEHFNQEISRLLIALSEQLTASMIMFVRQGSWAIASATLMVFEPATRNLEAVMALWTTAGICAAMIGLFKLKALAMSGWRKRVDWTWIKRGVTVSSMFLIATLAVRGVQTLDRYWIEALNGIDLVAAYVLLLGVASTLIVFLDAGVFTFTYPSLIKHNNDKHHEIANRKVRKMLVQTLLISAGFAVSSWLSLPWLLDWIGNPVYHEAINLYPWLLAAMTINALSMVPHYGLYARGCDKPIIYSHISSLIVFVLFTWAISHLTPEMAIPIGINAAFFVILIWKGIAYIEVIKDDKSPSASAKRR